MKKPHFSSLRTTRDIVAKAFWSLLLFALTLRTSAQTDSGYYVDDGNSIAHIYTGSPSDVKPEEWQVRLYKRGAPTGGRDNWGLITGKTAENVMKQLKDSQNFEIEFARFMARSTDDEVLTSFNPLGPIAVLKREVSSQPGSNEDSTLSKISEIISKIKEYKEAAEEIDKILNEKEEEPNPFAAVGKTFKEYADNLRDAALRVHQLEQLLNKSSDRSTEQIGALIDSVTKELNSSGEQLGQMKSAISKIQADKSTGSSYGSAGTGWLVTTGEGRKEWIFFRPDGTASVARLGENGWYNAGTDVVYRWRIENGILIWSKDGGNSEWRETVQGQRVTASLSNGQTFDTFSIERQDKSPLN